MKSDSFGSRLAKQVWITKGARFNAHRRLIRQNEWSLRVIGCLSVYLTIVSIVIVVPAFNVSPAMGAELTVVLAGLSLTLLVFSLLESNQNYLVKADHLHRCGMALGHVLHRISAILETEESGNTDVLNKLAEEYDAVLHDCGENHEPIDYDLLRAVNYSEFGISCYWAMVTRNWIWVRLYGIYFLVIAAPPILAIHWALTS